MLYWKGLCQTIILRYINFCLKNPLVSFGGQQMLFFVHIMYTNLGFSESLVLGLPDNTNLESKFFC